jgi:hypothetical protein
MKSTPEEWGNGSSGGHVVVNHRQSFEKHDTPWQTLRNDAQPCLFQAQAVLRGAVDQPISSGTSSNAEHIPPK